MPTTTARDSRSNLQRDAATPKRLKTWKEAREYFAQHLTPVSTGATGKPVYSNDDIKRLNVILPDEN